MRKGFNFYKSYWDVAKELPEKERLLFLELICRVEFLECSVDVIPDGSPMLKLAWASIKHSIKLQMDGFCAKTATQPPSTPPWQPPSEGATQPPWQQVQEKEKEEVKEKVKLNTGGMFVKPSLEELTEYVKLKGYRFDPEAFIAHYNSNGWKVGKNTMKSWKDSCVTWEKRLPPLEEVKDEAYYERKFGG